MTVFKIFIVAVALLLCSSLGAEYNCTRRYQRLLRDAGMVKAQCPNAAFRDCCQVRVFSKLVKTLQACSQDFCKGGCVGV